MRWFYFACFGGVGFINPFINLFYNSLGLTGVQIGTIGTAGAIVPITVVPLIVAAIKKQAGARTWLQGLVLVATVGNYLISRQVTLAPLIVIAFLQSFATSSISPISDTAAVSVAREGNTGFGGIRVWASFGWIVFVLLSGWLIDRFGYAAAFYGVISMNIVAILVLFGVQPRLFSSGASQAQSNPGILKTIQRLLKDRTLVGFAIALILIGFLNCGVTQFENLFLSQLGATKQLISVAGVLSAIMELPCMLLADRLVRRRGAHPLMLLSLGLLMVQRSAVLIFPFVPTILIVRFLGGFSFSLYTVSFVNLISSRTDPEDTGTAMAIFSITIAGLVNAAAAPISGAVFDTFGPRWLYALAAVGYSLGMLSLALSRPRKPALVLEPELGSEP